MKKKETIIFGLGIGAGIAIIFLLVFLAGVYIGSRKAGIFPFWERRFSLPHGYFPSRFGHGVIGTIDSLGEKMFVVKDRSGALKTVLIDDKTLLRRDGSSITFSDLRKDEQIIVIGEPQEKEGAIKAKVVRVIRSGL